MKVAVIGSLFLAAALISLKDIIPLMFTSIPSVRAEISSTFFYYAVSFVPDMFQMTLDGILKGMGE